MDIGANGLFETGYSSRRISLRQENRESCGHSGHLPAGTRFSDVNVGQLDERSHLARRPRSRVGQMGFVAGFCDYMVRRLDHEDDSRNSNKPHQIIHSLLCICPSF